MVRRHASRRQQLSQFSVQLGAEVEEATDVATALAKSSHSFWVDCDLGLDRIARIHNFRISILGAQQERATRDRLLKRYLYAFIS